MQSKIIAAVAFLLCTAVPVMAQDYQKGFAAYEAGKSGIREICGLQSHGVFVANPFSEELGELSPVFRPPSDKGLGFSDLLGDMDWVKS